MSIKSLIINPGSTSTKIAVFDDETLLLEETLRHTTEELSVFASIAEQKSFRKDIIVKMFADNDFDIHSLNMVVGRGGLLRPIESGTYTICDKMVADLENHERGEHASNLGGLIAKEIADLLDIPAFIVDPVVVDELIPEARLSGIPEIPRVSIFHALNQKAIAKRHAREVGRAYNELNVIVVHMGGGVSVGAHQKGRVVDVFNALDGDGAFSPERAGGIPSGALVRMCYSGRYTEKEMLKKITGGGGINAYLGTNDFSEVDEKSAAGNSEWKLVREAFIMQVSKDIGAMACVLSGDVDFILLTGGIAFSKKLTAELTRRVGFIAPVLVYPGEGELLALAEGALRVMRGEEEARQY
ncbi:MAG: butyrate kinase [Lachnospiraceae bacterium]|jgi:butyrate kinase|nr:butyrate kinase [Lachnospiraceae bacterium]